MTEELGSIGVKLRVDLSDLNRAEATAKKTIASLTREHTIPFKVGRINTSEIQREIDRITRGQTKVNLNVSLSGNAGRLLHRELVAQLKAAGPVPITVTANLSRAEINRIRGEITSAITRAGGVNIPFSGGGGGGGTGGPPPAAGSSAPRVPRPSRGGPSAASSPATASVAGTGYTPEQLTAFWRRENAEIDRRARAAERERTAQERRRAADEKRDRDRIAATYSPHVAIPEPVTPKPGQPRGRRAKASPATVTPTPPPLIADFGATPTGPSTGVTYRTSPTGETSVVRPVKRGPEGLTKVVKTTARQQTTTLSPDTLRRDQARPQMPTTEAEQEYASRPTQVRVPMSRAEADAESERAHGVRGVSRSGARRRGERELTYEERLAQDIQRDDLDTARTSERGAEISRPARKSAAFYGGRSDDTRAGNIVNRVMAGLQFYKFDPVLGRAFEAVNDGDTDRARAILRGFSGSLAGADPQRRKKFFRLFRNVENAPPEMVEKHAALQALFADVSQTEAAKRVANAEAELKAFKRPNGPKAEWDEGSRDHYEGLLDARKKAVSWQMDILRGIRRREGGGQVEGPLQRRLRMAREAKDLVLVGEKRPELYVSDSGKAEIVGEHGPEIRSFPESGQIKPYVPEWVRRGMAKDLTRREPGGPVRGYGGRKFRSFVEGEKEAIAGGLLSRSDSASVQRVFVVNWPAGGGGGFRGGSTVARAAGPRRITETEFEQIAKNLGLDPKALLGETAPVEPAKPVKESPARLEGLDPEERATGRILARRGAVDLERRISAAGHGVSEAEQLIPSRGPGPLFGQIFQTLLGGRGSAQTRAKEAREAVNAAKSATSAWRAEQVKLNDALAAQEKAQTPEQRDEARKSVEALTKSTITYREEAERLTDVAELAEKGVLGTTSAIRSAVTGLAGITFGTVAFSAILGATQAGIEGLASALGPAIERASGFTSTSAAVTSALGQQIKALGGARDAAFAATAAQVGLDKSTAASIGPLLQQRAATEQNNKTLGEALDQLHAFEEARRRGGNQGLFATTSGAFGTSINGIASTQEILKKELNAPEATSTLRARALQAQAAGQTTTPDRVLNHGMYQIASGAASVAKVLEDTASVGQILSDRLEFFNNQLRKGGSSMQFVANATDQAAKDFASLADKAGLTEIGDVARGLNKVVLVDPSGKPVTSTDVLVKAIGQLNESFSAADPEELIKQLRERIIPAQRSQFAAEGQLSRVTNRASFALQNLAQPTPGIGKVPFEQGLVGTDQNTGKIDTAARQAAKTYRTEIGGAASYVNAQIEQGRKDLINLVPANLRGEFTNLLGDIERTGQQISKIQLGIQQQQVNLQVAEYNNQLRIARRSLQDAKDIQAGLSGETRNTLGGIEGQNIALQRQLQLLGFELQQRQINFRLATAGFVAPGTTPEERAARIEEAKKEAEFAQKQLDLQKQIAANQFKGVQISVGRDVTDLLAQINLLQQGRTVTLNTAAAARALDVLNKKQQLLLAQAQTYIEEGVKITQAAINAAAEVQRQTGKGFAYLLSKTAEAWGIFGDQAKAILQALQGTAPGRTQTSGTPVHGAASGIIGDTLSETQLTVGEAGREKVAVLKNPKIVPMSTLAFASGNGGGGGGSSAPVNLTVIVTGNTISSELDLERVAQRIIDKAEQRLMQKTSLFGLRRA